MRPRLIKSLAWRLIGQVALILVNCWHANSHNDTTTNNNLSFLQSSPISNLNQQMQLNDLIETSDLFQIGLSSRYIEQTESPPPNQRITPIHRTYSNATTPKLDIRNSTNQVDLYTDKLRTKLLKKEKVKKQPQAQTYNKRNKTTRTETTTATITTKRTTTKVKFKLNQEPRNDEESDLATLRDVAIQANQVRSHEQMPRMRNAASESKHSLVKREITTAIQAGQTTNGSRLDRPTVSNAINDETSDIPIQPLDLDAAVSRNRRTASPVPNNQVQSLVGERIIIPCSNLTTLNNNWQQQNSRQQNDKPFPANNRRQPATVGGQQQQQAKLQRNQGPSSSSSQNSNGGVSLIVWHKDDQLNSPIFVADARGVGSLREAKQQILAENLRGRARLQFAPAEAETVTTTLPSLLIDESSQQDAGLYTCTVEFHKAPTQTHQVRAQIIDPPRNMVIRDEMSQQKLLLYHSSLAGPFDEDSRLTLSCEVELPTTNNNEDRDGDEGASYVSWWQLDSVTQLNGGGGGGDNFLSNSNNNLIPIESATYLTTLSNVIDPTSDSTDRLSPKSQSSLAYENQLIGWYATRASLDSVLNQQQQQQRTTTPFAAATTKGSEDQQLVHHGHRNQAHRFLKHWRRFTNQTIRQHQQSANAGGNLEQSTMFINQLSRANLGDEFMCLSNNNNFSSPLNATIRLNMNLKPIEVRIVNKPTAAAVAAFKLGQKSIVECHVFGSRPSAKISWFLGSEELDLTKKDSSSGGGADQDTDREQQDFLINEFSRDMNNLTKISYLTLMPDLSHNQLSLTCSANNPKLANSPVLSDTIVMNVQYPPRLNLQLGSSFSRSENAADSIKIGTDIFMDCQIDSNPRIDDLTWLFNDSPIQANVSAGIIMSNQSLVLQKIKIHQSGSYQCLAQNLLGKTASNKLVLKPRFKPQCDLSRTRLRYELPINQPARIDCHVLAEPSDDLHFTWRFNQTYGLLAADLSLDSYHLEELRKFETNYTKSSLIFVPKTRRHYGQLLCGASNSMGEQEQPCSIQMIPLELPDPVLNCFIDNQTDSSFGVHCQPPATTSSAAQSTHSSSSSNGNRQNTHYLLELYLNDGDDDGDEDNESSATRSRRPQPSPVDSTAALNRRAQGEESDYHSTLLLNDQQQLSDRNQLKVKSLTSETPNFNVNDLRPNTSYNILVYVENSKGRSLPAHHVANTKPSDHPTTLWNTLEVSSSEQQQQDGHSMVKNSSNNNGRVELISKSGNNKNVQPNVASKLISYLKIDNYFNGDFWNYDKKTGAGSDRSAKPLIGLALVVLLLSISIVCVVFFVNRFCIRSRGSKNGQRTAGRNGSKDKTSNGDKQQQATQPQQFNTNNSEKGNNDYDDVDDDDGGRLSRHYLTTTVAQRQIVGSGSDTSRETNTESTLISSPQTTGGTTDELGSSSSNMRGSGGNNKFVAFGNTANLQQHPLGQSATLTNNRKCLQQNSGGNLSMPRRRDCSSSLSNNNNQQTAIYSIISKNSSNLALQQQHQQHMEDQFREQQHSCTPQVSIQSESDCCLSASNEQSSDHLMEQQKFVGFLAHDQNNIDAFGQQQPVYVISRNDLQLQQQQQQSPLNGETKLWSIDSSPTYQIEQNVLENSSIGTLEYSGASSDQQQHLARLNPCQASAQQHYSTVANNNNRCQLVETSTASAQPTTISYMPNSISIPVSLSDRLHVLTRNNSSQSNLVSLQQQQQPQEFAIHPNNHSFLTLIPSSSASIDGNICLQQAYTFPATMEDAIHVNGLDHHMDHQALQQQQQLHETDLSPPLDFATDYRRFKEKFGINNVNNTQERGQFDSGYLDSGSGQQQSTSRRRRTNSFDTETEQQRQQHKQKTLQNRVKFNTDQAGKDGNFL